MVVAEFAGALGTLNDLLGLALLILSVVASLIALMQMLVVRPMNRKLEETQDKIINTMERRFLDTIFRRMETIEMMGHARARQSLIWAKALRDELADHNIKAPDPEMMSVEDHFPPRTGDR